MGGAPRTSGRANSGLMADRWDVSAIDQPPSLKRAVWRAVAVERGALGWLRVADSQCPELPLMHGGYPV